MSKISKSNFQFIPDVFDYKVVYTSPSGKTKWMAHISVVALGGIIDVDKPKLASLHSLRCYIKYRGIKVI